MELSVKPTVEELRSLIEELATINHTHARAYLPVRVHKIREVPNDLGPKVERKCYMIDGSRYELLEWKTIIGAKQFQEAAEHAYEIVLRGHYTEPLYRTCEVPIEDVENTLGIADTAAIPKKQEFRTKKEQVQAGTRYYYIDAVMVDPDEVIDEFSDQLSEVHKHD